MKNKTADNNADRFYIAIKYGFYSKLVTTFVANGAF